MRSTADWIVVETMPDRSNLRNERLLADVLVVLPTMSDPVVTRVPLCVTYKAAASGAAGLVAGGPRLEVGPGGPGG